MLSTANPASLHVLSSTSFSTVHIIPSSALVPYAHLSSSALNFNKPNNISDSNNNNYDNDRGARPNVNVNAYVPIDATITLSNPAPPSEPEPVYALSHRLIAYASSPPRPDSPIVPASTTPTSALSGQRGAGAELGSAALKVGGSVLSGMKSLGGMAVSAARAKLDQSSGNSMGAPTSGLSASRAGTGTGKNAGGRNSGGGSSGLGGLWFSRSAPAATTGSGTATGGSSTRRESVTSVSGSSPPDSDFTPSSSGSKGSHITVLDLGAANAKGLVAEFLASNRQVITGLIWSADGTSLIVSPEDGRVVRVFHIRPSPLLSPLTPSPWHTYNLRRGRTSGTIEGISESRDGRWVGVSTRQRTVHVFGVNPYGGKMDWRSHLEGKVINVGDPVSSPSCLC